MAEKKEIIRTGLFDVIEVKNDNNDNDVLQLFHQRVNDGYVNATELCKYSGKKFSHYYARPETKEFLQVLSSDAHISASELVCIIKGGDYRLQGTWVHPQVAIHLAQWLSPLFAVKVSKLVFDWFYGNIPKNKLPYNLERYDANMHKIPQGYFSILNEMTTNLIAPMEKQGYTLPDNMIPDISQGKMFCGWLRKEKHMEPDNFGTYEHEYADGRKVQAKLYPNELLADFRKHFYEEWITKKSEDYFTKRDLKALPYLEKVKILLNDIKPNKQIAHNTQENIKNKQEDIDFINNIKQARLELPENDKPEDIIAPFTREFKKK